MVLSILIALAAAPGLLGTQEAIRQGQAKERREEHRARRCNLIASCVRSSRRSREINGRRVVLRDGKLYIDIGESEEENFGHPFAGYFLPYPDASYEGVVTTITDAEPMLNWIYVDQATYEVKYGVRADAQPNLTGPFDCTRLDRRLTFEGWEGFVAVEESPLLWALYFDRDDNGLRGKVQPGTRVLEVELSRKEKPIEKSTNEADTTEPHSIPSAGQSSHPSQPSQTLATEHGAQPDSNIPYGIVNSHEGMPLHEGTNIPKGPHIGTPFDPVDRPNQEDDAISRCNTQGSTIGDDTFTSGTPLDDTPASSIQGDEHAGTMAGINNIPSFESSPYVIPKADNGPVNGDPLLPRPLVPRSLPTRTRIDEHEAPPQGSNLGFQASTPRNPGLTFPKNPTQATHSHYQRPSVVDADDYDF